MAKLNAARAAQTVLSAEFTFESACVGLDAASLEQAAKKIKTMNKIIRMVII